MIGGGMMWEKDYAEEADKADINKLLNDTKFRSIVESDIGKVSNVQVDWENNEIRFYGEKNAKSIMIDATLATLRNQIQ